MKMMAEEAKMKDELCRRLVSDCVSGGGGEGGRLLSVFEGERE